MNRYLISATVSLAIVVGVMFNMPQVLSADQALIVKDGGACGMFFGSEETGDAVGGLGQITMQLENADKVTLKCRGRGLANLTGTAQHFDGFPCGILTPGGEIVLTEDSHATVSASGNGTLSCTYTKPTE